MKDGPKNRLRSQDIHKIVDVFNKRLEVDKYSRMVSFEEIEHNEFNLNLPRYIDSQTPEDLQDIAGHLQGGIPAADVEALKKYWDVCPSLKRSLMRELRPDYFELAVPTSELKATIYSHPEFEAFIAEMNEHFNQWKRKSAASLMDLKAGCQPKSIISALAEDLLKHYSEVPLIDAYDIYQHLMDYWAGTMQDDLYLIAADGWKAETSRIVEKDKKGREKDKGWTCDLIPKPLIVARYYEKEQGEIEALSAESEAVTASLAELEEEHGGEEGAFAELGKVNKANVSSRFKEVKGDQEAKDEAAVLNEWLALNQKTSEIKKQIKEAEADLDAKAYAHYPKLTEAEIKQVAVDDQWMAALEAAVQGEVDRVSQNLTQRVIELAERYETSVSQMNEHVNKLEEKVNHHLERMGFTW
jgi:type I restriction enzyme M protein